MSTFPVDETIAPAKGVSADLRRTSQAKQHAADPDRLLTISDVAEWLGVSKAWVYDHATRKRPFLPCFRFGYLTRFRRDEIQKFIQEHAKPNGTSST